MTDIIDGALMLIIGGVFAAHCALAARREFKSGVAKGRVNNFRRDTAPISFWTSICGTALASMLGAALGILGLSILVAEFGLIR